MIRETGKGRKSRIELGYYRAPDSLARWRTRLCLIAVLAVAGWLAAAAIAGRNTASHAWSLEPTRLASKGPLARPHAMWDATCEACHISFAPINDSHWAPAPWTSSKEGSKRCTTCHAGPAHHKAEVKDEAPACAECHRDHRGRDASLLTMDDSACTTCHRDLNKHRDLSAVPSKVAPTVTRFDLEHHPEITASWAIRSRNPTRIKFNHALHMAEGLTLEKGGSPLTVAQFPAQDRDRYGWKGSHREDHPVQLACALCHQPDREDDARAFDSRAGSAGAPRASGAYMLPIVYENHCAGCHPLQYDAKLPERQMRHGLSAQEVVNDLRKLYTNEAVNADPDLLRQYVPPQPAPGQPSSRRNPLMHEAVDDKVVTAAKLLFGANVDETVRRRRQLPAGRRGCVECHTLKPTAEPIVSSKSLATLEIEPVLMTPVWFESSFFNHRTHRALGCLQCHPGATKSKQNGDWVLLPGIYRCVSCHAPADGQNRSQPGGASTNCTECHRYHNGDHPEQGLGARARRGEVEQTLERFLSGGRGLQRQ